MSSAESGLGEWKYVFPALTALALATAILACSELLRLPPAVRLIPIEVYVLICSAIFLAHLMDEDYLLKGSLIIFALFLLPAIMVYSGDSRWSTIYYGVVGLGCWVMVDENKDKSFWSILRQTVVMYWVVAGALFMVSRLPLFRHALPVLSDMQAHRVLNARVLLTLTVVVLYLGAAAAKISRMSRAAIPDLPPTGIEPLEAVPSILVSILRPLSLAAVFILDALWMTANLLWKVVAETGVQLSRLAQAFVELCVAEFLNRMDLLRTLRVVVAVTLPLAVCHVALNVAPIALAYVRSSPHVSGSLFSLVRVFGFGLSICILLVLEAQALEEDPFDAARLREGIAQASFCGSMFIVAFAAAGLLNYFAAQQQWLREVGFERIGLFTLTMLFVMLTMLVYHSIKQVQDRRKQAQDRRKTVVSVGMPFGFAGTRVHDATFPSTPSPMSASHGVPLDYHSTREIGEREPAIDPGAAPYIYRVRGESRPEPIDYGVKGEPRPEPLDYGDRDEPRPAPVDYGVRSEPRPEPIDYGVRDEPRPEPIEGWQGPSLEVASPPTCSDEPVVEHRSIPPSE